MTTPDDDQADDQPTGPAPAAPRRVQRVIDSYDGQPCTYTRPADAPVRPGEPCGEIHTCCRGHNAGTRHPDRRGDPCHTPPLTGVCTCARHSPPETMALSRQARAQVSLGHITGNAEPVEDPMTVLAQVAGEIVATRQAVRDLVATIQANEGDALSIEAGAEMVDDEGRPVGRHLEVTGDGLVALNPSGVYKMHPLVELLERYDDRATRVLSEMSKLGFVERAATLREQQLDQTTAALRLMFRRMGIDENEALPRFAAAARELGAIDTTVADTVYAQAERMLPTVVEEQPEDQGATLWPT